MKSAAPKKQNIIWSAALFIPNFPIGWQEVSMSKAHVIIYSRPGCHLCDEAKAAILSAGCSDQFVLDEINIESSDELLNKYRYDIPVITIDGVESFIHRVDRDEFRTRITRIKAD
jgi:glutaredoxin